MALEPKDSNRKVWPGFSWTLILPLSDLQNLTHFRARLEWSLMWLSEVGPSTHTL